MARKRGKANDLIKLSAMLAEEEYDKIAPVIACTLPALTDSMPERKRGELAGEVTSELQVVGKAASIAIHTWVRNNDKTKARAEEREKNIGWIKRLFTAWSLEGKRSGAGVGGAAGAGARYGAVRAIVCLASCRVCLRLYLLTTKSSSKRSR